MSSSEIAGAQTTSTAAKMSQDGRTLRFHLIAATAVYVIDGLYFGQGVITFLVAAFFVLAGVIKTLIRAVRQQPIAKAPLLKMALYGACFGAVISTIVINNKIARNRAEMVVAAVKQYKIKYKHYPDSLQNLVPEFLPSVPLAKYSFAFNNFMYWRRVGKPVSVDNGNDQAQEYATLLYFALPPFGRPTYNFEQDRWGYLD